MMDDVTVLRNLRAPEGFTQTVLRKVGLIDGYARVDSPVGPVYVAVTDAGIKAVMVAADDADFERRYVERFGRRAERREDLARPARHALAGDAVDVDLRACGEFQRAVLEATRSIPAGSVRPYSWIARAIGRPRAVRAVGTALATNPVPLVIPCHRVVRTDGRIGRYSLGSGAPDKLKLLRLEGVAVKGAGERVRADGFR